MNLEIGCLKGLKELPPRYRKAVLKQFLLRWWFQCCRFFESRLAADAAAEAAEMMSLLRRGSNLNMRIKKHVSNIVAYISRIFLMAALAKKKTELATLPNFDAPFLSQKANKENADMNQYWYSESSIQVAHL